MSADAPIPDVACDPIEPTNEVEAEIWETLDGIPDPHLPISLVELAMVYGIDYENGNVRVEITFPCMGCPAYEFIQDDIRGALRLVEGVDTIDVEVVWDPVWSKEFLTDEVRERLRRSGIGL